MTQKWNSGSEPVPAIDDFMDDVVDDLQEGVETAITHDSGSADPSSGAPAAWGANDVGRIWHDRTDPANPKLKIWQQLSATPTYGWRTLRLLKTRYLGAPQAVTFTTASPAASDVVWEDVNLTTLLDGAGVQDTSQTAPTVRAVLLKIQVAAGASETLGATGSDSCYLAVREKGSTQDIRIQPQIADRYFYAYVWVGLDSSEVFQFMVDVGGGTPNFRYAAWVVAIQEEI